MKTTRLFSQKMKSLQLTLVIILGAARFGSGQVTPIPDAVIPPSPTAFNLGKYGLMKTGLFTGTVNAEIPLLEYKTPNLTVPISLSYSSNGIRVEEAESRTGLIWNLNAGGVIIRNIKGNPDIYPAQKENAPYPDEVIDQLVSERTGGLAPVVLQMYLLRGNTPGFDTEYDVFSFNFLNIKGKFIITSRGEVVQESKSALRIEVINSIDNGFIVTDDQGIQYKFTETETTQVSSGPDARNPPAVTAWYLSQIVHPKGDIVNFSYDRIVTTIQYSGMQSYTKLSGLIDNGDGEWGNFVAANSGYKQHLSQLNTIDGKRITRITGNYTGSIMFFNNLQNNGQPGDSLLTDIRLFNDQEQLVESIELDYTQTSNDRVFLSTVTFLDTLKKYSLNYYSPGLFPRRTSLSQDYWGYFNGASNQTLLPRDKDFDAKYPGLTFYGNREPVPDYAVYGMLQKVTYPTGGYSMMQYEPNSYYTSKVERNYNNISLVGESGSSPSGEVMSDIITAGANQTVDIFVTLSNSSTCPESTDPDVIRRKGGQMRMFDITTGQNIPFIGTLDTEITITNGLGDRTYQVALQSGHQYQLCFSTFACSKLLGTLRYETSASTVYYNAVTGGMRLRSTKHYSLTGENSDIYYKYVDSLESERSSGTVTINSPSFYSVLQKAFFARTTGCSRAPAIPEGGRVDFRYFEDKLSSNSVDFMFNQAGNNITYKTVIESNGVNNENGCTLHRFRTSIDGGGQIISEYSNSYIANKAVTNLSWDNGLENYTAYYSKNGQNLTLLKEEFLEYEGLQIRSVPMIRIQQRYSTPCGILHPPAPENPGPLDPYPITNRCSCEGRRFIATQQNSSGHYQFGTCTANHRHSWYRDVTGVVKCNGKGNHNTFDNIPNPFYQQPVGSDVDLNGIFPLDAVYYHFYSFLHHLSSRKEIMYENGNTLETNISYTYDDLNHLTSTTYQDSKAHVIRTTNLYPHDFASSAIYDLMVDENMTGHVIRTTVFDLTADKEVSVSNTEFMLWNNQFIVPKEIKRSYGGNTLATEVRFASYNSRNNISEIIKIDGLTEVYLWGYNDQYPVAKITGSDYATAITTVTQAQINAATGIANNDVNVRALLNSLRAIHGAMVTTYTYAPLIGITSETDPGGHVIYYEYDSFGRLKIIRDDDGNVLKTYDYQYQIE